MIARCLAAFFLLTCFSPIRAEGQTAKEVVDRYVRAIGGYEALDRIQTIQYDRILTHIEEGRVIGTRVYHARPHRYRIEYPGSGSFRVVNGSRAWRGTSDPESGWSEWEEITPWSGTDFEQRFGLFIHYEEKEYEVEFVGAVLREGRRLHQLTFGQPGAPEWNLFFDVETGLFTMFEPAPGTTVTLHDFREVDGVLFPHLTEGRGITPQGVEFHHLNTVTNLKLNAPMADTLFLPPERGGRAP